MFLVRQLFLALIGAASLIGSQAGDALAANGKGPVLTVVIEKIRSQMGQVHIGIWSDPELFGERDGRVAGTASTIDGVSQTLVIEGLEPGTYAIAAFHDENDNGDFDQTWIGLPDEGLGFSNGAWISVFGAPSFESAAIELRAPVTRAVITLRY